MSELTYTVPGMRCEHCRSAIAGEVAKVAGVREVEVDLEAHRVVVHGEAVRDADVRTAIDEAGYDVAA